MGNRNREQISNELISLMESKVLRQEWKEKLCAKMSRSESTTGRPQPKTPSGAPECLYYFSGTLKDSDKSALEGIINICEINRYWPFTIIQEGGTTPPVFCAMEYGDVDSLWAEDYFHIFTDGTVKIAEPFVVDNDGLDIQNVVENGRTHRLQSLKNSLSIDITENKKRCEECDQLNKILTQSSTGLNVIADLTDNKKAGISYMASCLDGGNVLPGEDFVLIGKDSLCVTCHQNRINDQEAKELIAHELGYDTGKVFFVEQPGTFHLDLDMMLLGKNTASSRERIVVARSYNGVDLSLIHEELKTFGFEVIVDENNTVARENGECSEEDLIMRSGHWQYNFFNGEFVLDKQGKLCYITNGVSTEIKEADTIKENFVKFLKSQVPEVSEVIFLDEMTEIQLNKANGGVGCRFKGGPLAAREVLYLNSLEQHLKNILK